MFSVCCTFSLPNIGAITGTINTVEIKYSTRKVSKGLNFKLRFNAVFNHKLNRYTIPPIWVKTVSVTNIVICNITLKTFFNESLINYL